MTIDYIPGTTSNLVGDPAEGGAFSSGNKGEIAGANTAAANAATSATAAAASATAAAQSASDLSAAETNAATSATASAASATAAAADRASTQGFLGSVTTLYNSFEASYLGTKSSDPSTDNDGGALLVGALYYNLPSNILKVWNGTAWNAAAVDGATILLKAQNLADLPSASTARTNLGLGTMALEAAADYAPLAGATFTGNVTAPEFIGVLQGETVFKAKAGEALSKGDAVYVSGISGNTPVVSKADADGASTYPAFGLASADAALNGTLDVITAGQLKNFDTSGFTLGDTLYLSTTPGVLTATPPAGEGSVIQNMGKVEREHASAGSILVVGAGRSAATPNLNDGNIFIGNSSNKAVTSSFNTLADARIANNIIDEDSFSTDSATRAPSQQSVKQYVADQTANIQGDITNVITGNGLTGGGTNGAVTVAVDTAVVATASNTISLNNKTLNTPTINSPDINGGTVDGVTIGGSTAAAGTFTTGTIATADINGGAIDGTTIGGSTAAAGNFTTLGATGFISGTDLTLTDSTPRIQFIDSDGTNQKTEQVQAGGSFVTTVRNNTSHGSIDFKSNNGTNNLLRFRVATDGDFNFYKNNGSTVGVKWDAPNGRLGISTTSPAQKLHVDGKIITTEGIYLGGTGGANLLEDYEEGTFTPTLFDKNATDGNQADVGTTVGTYTKVGDVVTCVINLSNINTSTNSMVSGQQLHIHGLPFTSRASRLVPVPLYCVQVSTGSPIVGPFAIFGGNGTFMQLRVVFEGGGTSALDVSAINSTSSDIHLAFSYHTDS